MSSDDLSSRRAEIRRRFGGSRRFALALVAAGVGTAVLVAVAAVLLGVGSAPAILDGGPTRPSGPAATAASTPTPASPTPTRTPVPTPTLTPRPTRTTPSFAGEATVLSSTGGDTVSYRNADGRVRTARLAGVDAPGVTGDDPDRYPGVLGAGPADDAPGRDCLARYGRRATLSLRDRLVGASVDVSAVGTAGGVVLTRRNRSINRDLVRSGLARSLSDRYVAAERAARDAERGLWECTTVEPGSPESAVPTENEVRPESAADTGGPRIEKIRPNPTNGLDEIVVVRNTGQRSVAIGGWHLTNEGGRAAFFPDGTILDPYERLVVHTGSGPLQPPEGHVYLGRNHELWGDSTGTVTLVSPDGNRRISVTY